MVGMGRCVEESLAQGGGALLREGRRARRITQAPAHTELEIEVAEPIDGNVGAADVT